jgi:hypothetical protein
MTQGAGQIDERVQQLIIAGGRKRKLGAYRCFFRSGVLPPLALEVEYRQISFA